MARVLLVEDYELVQLFLCDAVRQAGHHATCVKTFGEAARELQSNPYDLLISNVLLPDGKGYDLAPIAERRGVRSLLITGHPDEAEALAIAKTTHLLKPFRLDELIALIDNTLGLVTRGV